jgi:hypothetical protein
MRIIRSNTNGWYMIDDSRFCIKRTSSLFVSWRIHDAEWVTDAETRQGLSAPCVAVYKDLDEAFQYISRVISGELRTYPLPSEYADGKWPELEARVSNSQ